MGLLKWRVVGDEHASVTALYRIAEIVTSSLTTAGGAHEAAATQHMRSKCNP
jgi:hypothetical protein